MEIFTNHSKIDRMALIAKILMYTGIGTFIGLVIMFFTNGQNIPQTGSGFATFYGVFYGVSFLAIILLNLARRLQSQYSAQPEQVRVDEQLNPTLKALDGRYRLYHHYLPAAHVLVAPSGVYALVLAAQSGEVRWNDKKRTFEQAAGGAMAKIFSIDSFGPLHTEADKQANQLAKHLQTLFGNDTPPVQSIVVLLHPNIKVNDTVAQAPVMVMRAKDLKNHLRKLGKGATLNQTQLATLDAKLGVTPQATPATAAVDTEK